MHRTKTQLVVQSGSREGSAYLMFRDRASGPEIGFRSRMSLGFYSGEPQNRQSGRPEAPILRVSRLQSGRNPDRKPHLRPGNIIA